MKSKWFDKLPPARKQAYLRAHPRSKLKGKAGAGKPKAFSGPRFAFRKNNFPRVAAVEEDETPQPKGKRKL